MTAPTFARTSEGVVITSAWPSEMIATRDFIESAQSPWLERKGRTLSFTLLNGSAAYRIATRGEYPRSYVLKRVG